jgi:GWxTD domain-containing protein
MTILEDFVRTPLAGALGWALFHSLWQGAIAAVVLLAVLRVSRSPRARYAAACAAMLAMFICFAITFSHYLPARIERMWTLVRFPPAAPPSGSLFAGIPARFTGSDILPWLAPVWIAGLILFQFRSVANWVGARRLRHRGVCSPPPEWQQRFLALKVKLQVSRTVTLLESCLADVPVVIGHLRPVILIPVGLLSGMPACQIEVILLHELAHVRRLDYLTNLLQIFLEGLLFYHPATWWISSVIRQEREHCCDDLAVAASGSAHEYASALAALEGTRWNTNQAALAATGGSLMKRIHRLLYRQDDIAPAATSFFSVAVLMIAAAGVLMAWQIKSPATPEPQSSQAPVGHRKLLVSSNATAEPQEETVSPYTKWLKEDVAYIIDDRERTAFLNLGTDAEREHFIEQFWLRRDPTPGTTENEYKEEHYRRINYVNSHFASDSGKAGWKTDRGRIYITFGPPDELEFHPAGGHSPDGATNATYPVMSWLYHHLEGIGDRVIIEFIDPEKNGEFRMTKDPNP